MRRFFLSLMVLGVLATQAYSAAPQQKAQTLSTEDALKAYRSDLQGARADIMAKNLTLTAAQAAKFWPEFAKFEAEQATIIDEQLKSIQSFVDNYATMDDATALRLANATLSRDLQMNTLRTKWVTEFGKILPVKTAVRVIQIDRRLGLAHQLSLASQLPLIY